MSLECEYKPITELLSFIVDNRGKSAPTSDKGIKLIATNCIKNNSLYPMYEKVRYVTQETYDNWFRAHPQPGDIIFVNKGAPGSVCMVPKEVDFCIAQDMMAFRVDEEKIYNKYLFAFLRSPQIQRFISNYHVGTMIPHFKKTDLDKLMVPVPSIEMQKKIGDIYFLFCDKIELNNKLNENLVQCGDMYYRDLLNNGSDWTSGTFDDILEFYDSMRKPLSSKQRENMERNYPYYGATSIVDYVEQYIFEGTYILISEDGANVVDDNGYPLIQYTYDKFWVNNHAHVVKGKNGLSEAGIYFILKNTRLQSIVTGAAQPKINQANLRGYKIKVPSQYDVMKINKFLDPILKQIIANGKENGLLISIRDSILPKLMSGKINLDNIELDIW